MLKRTRGRRHSSDFSLYGRWWFEQPQQAYFSELVVDVRGRSLLKTVPSWPFARRAFGELQDGQEATLLRPQAEGPDAAWHELFIDLRVADADQLRISEARIYFVQTHAVAHFPRFALVGEPVLPDDAPESWPQHLPHTSQGRFDDLEISMTVSIEHPDRLIRRRIGNNECQMITKDTEDPCLTICMDVAAPFEEVKEQIFELQDFVSFGIGRAAIIDRVEFITDDEQEFTYYGKWRCAKDHAGLALRNMLFSLDYVCLKDALEAWYFALDNLYPAPQVTTYRYYSPGFLEHDLSASVSALENMHNQTGLPQQNKELPLEGAEALRETLLEQPSTPARKAALKALKAKPVDVTFGEKLLELTSRLPPLVFETLAFTPEEWVEEVKVQRNKVSHTASHVGRQGRNASDDLARGIARSRLILMLAILREGQVPGCGVAVGDPSSC